METSWGLNRNESLGRRHFLAPQSDPNARKRANDQKRKRKRGGNGMASNQTHISVKVYPTPVALGQTWFLGFRRVRKPKRLRRSLCRRQKRSRSSDPRRPKIRLLSDLLKQRCRRVHSLSERTILEWTWSGTNHVRSSARVSTFFRLSRTNHLIIFQIICFIVVALSACVLHSWIRDR
jgi:hypothetical protein